MGDEAKQKLLDALGNGAFLAINLGTKELMDAANTVNKNNVSSMYLNENVLLSKTSVGTYNLTRKASGGGKKRRSKKRSSSKKKNKKRSSSKRRSSKRKYK
jgi:hypothetical protein